MKRTRYLIINIIVIMIISIPFTTNALDNGNYISDLNFGTILKDLRDVSGQRDAAKEKGIEDPFYFRYFFEIPFPGFRGKKFGGWGGYEDPGEEIIYPLTWGLYYEEKYYTVYGLIYLSDLTEGFTEYDRIAFGIGTALIGIPIKLDLTVAKSSLQYQMQVDVPFLKTFFTAGARHILKEDFKDKYSIYEVEKGEEGVKAGKFLMENLGLSTSIFKYLGISLNYDTIFDTYSPELFASYSKFLGSEGKKTTPFDFTVYFKTHHEKKMPPKMKDYEVRLVLYHLFDVVAAIPYKGHELYSIRHGVFIGVSYRKEVPFYYEGIYEGDDEPQGWGFEFGWAMKLMGIENWGVKDSLFLKVCFFANYSEYFNTYPFHLYGIKLKVIF